MKNSVLKLLISTIITSSVSISSVAYASGGGGGHGDPHGKVKEVKTELDTAYPVKIPTFEGRHLEEGNRFYERGLYDNAYHEYFMATRLNPSFWQGFRGIGYVYMRKGKIVKALNSYLKAIDIINPVYAAQTLDEGKTAMKEGDLYLAASKFQKILHIPPEAGVLVDEGIQLLKENKKSQAQKKFDEAAKIDLTYDKKRPRGSYADVHFKLGTMNYEKKKYPEAIKEFEWAVELDPSEFGYHYGLGNAYYKQAFKNKKKPELDLLTKAVKSYENAYRFNPRDIDVMYNLAAARVDEAGIEKAKALEKASEADKYYAEIYKGSPSEKDKKKKVVAPPFSIADRFKNVKEIHKIDKEVEKINAVAAQKAQKAVNLLEKVTNVNPVDIKALEYLGDAYTMVGQKPDDFIRAVDSYQKILTLNSSMVDLYTKIGTTYYMASNITPHTEDLPINSENSKLYGKFGKKYYKAEMLSYSKANFNSYLNSNLLSGGGANSGKVRAYLETVNKDIDNLGFRIPDKSTGR
ncbi:MAG: tetratricopeptide repeat protein [Candidatus Sericytochromatia bacterium]